MSRVVVSGWPICAECGRPVEAVGPDRWRHTAVGRKPRRSRWLAPGLADLRGQTYEEFCATYPWASTAGAGMLATLEGQWREAVARLERYHAAVAAAARRRSLEAGENPYLDVLDLLAAPVPEPDDAFEAVVSANQPATWGVPHGVVQLLDLAERRRELVQLFAWAVPTEEALGALARYAPLVECGAGMGYWAALLRARGIDVVATDAAPPGSAANEFHRRGRRPWTEVARATGVDTARRHPDRALVLCWPPYDDDAASYDTLRAYRGDVVIHVGEHGGASGSVRFHRELALNWTLAEQVDLPHWPRLEDRVHVYTRNAVRRPHGERDRCEECRRFVPTGSLGRCDRCFAARPPALALRVGRHRAEYSEELLEALPAALRAAFEASPDRIL